MGQGSLNCDVIRSGPPHLDVKVPHTSSARRRRGFLPPLETPIRTAHASLALSHLQGANPGKGAMCLFPEFD